MLRKLELVSANGLLAMHRIVELSARHGMDMHGLAMRYALERFLSRIFANDAGGKLALGAEAAGQRVEIDADSVTLKGGLTMFLAEGVEPMHGRSTSDADFHIAPTADGGHAEHFVEFLRANLNRRAGGFDDGVTFDLSTLAVARVKDGQVPGGKVTVTAQIGKLALKIRSDIAFDARPIGDDARREEYPHMLRDAGDPPILVRRTPWEYSVADKLQAMVRQGAGNYRLRDYYDMFVILRGRGRDGAPLVDTDRLRDAIRATFDLYGSEIPGGVDDMPALSDAFVAAKTPRWDSERETKHFGSQVPSFREVVDYLREEIEPVLQGMQATIRPF